MKEIDLGYKHDDEPCCEAPEAPKVTYPSLHINRMKEDDGMEMGTEFYAKVKLCKVGARKNYSGKGYDCEYEVKTLSPMPEKKEVKGFPEIAAGDMVHAPIRSCMKPLLKPSPFSPMRETGTG